MSKEKKAKKVKTKAKCKRHSWIPYSPVSDTPHKKCANCGEIKYGKWDFEMFESLGG